MWTHGTFFWNELRTRDLEAAKKFYGAALGWTFDNESSNPISDYWVAKSGGMPTAGLMTMDENEWKGIPDHWFCYIAVDDVDKRAELIQPNEGTLFGELFNIPDIGRVAFLQDNSGATVGYMTPDIPDDAMQGDWDMSPYGKFFWNELMARDADSAKKFYSATLDWTFDQVPSATGGDYWVARSDSHHAAGIFEMTGKEFVGIPEFWFSYIAVQDIEESCNLVKKSGGKLLKPVFEVKDVGKFGIIEDTCGVCFGFMEPVTASVDCEEEIK